MELTRLPQVPSAGVTYVADDNPVNLPPNRQEVYSILVHELKMPPDVAEVMVLAMTDSQVSKYLSLVNGQDTITPAEAKQVWNLTDEQFEELFGPSGSEIGFSVPGNPFSRITLHVAALAYAMEIDIHQLMSVMRTRQHDLAVESAHETRNGAISAFAVNMLAGIATAAVGFYAHRARRPETGPDGKPAEPRTNPNDWPPAMTAGLISQPLQSIGDFTDKMWQFESAMTEADRAELEAWYRQLEAALSRIEKLS